ncbi:recombination regulator RecX [uncultured Clostridium sp.]|uniref:recombination regulator RecX n=1 Tax=uncultured Clostridium sp. TaxID=59620 RepID=UPI003216B4FC
MSKVITKIEAQKKKDNRVNIFINDEFAFGCSSELVYYHNLAKGKEINVEELKKVVVEDNYLTAKTKTLKYIERALKSEFQVREFLQKKEYEDNVIDRVIEFLKEYKFIDDEYYAKAFVTQNIRIEGKGNIKYKLIKKGISEDMINSTLSEISSEDEEAVALKLAEKKLKVLCKNEGNINKIKSKLNTFLISKGYNFDTIKSVVNKLEIREEKNIEEFTEDSYDQVKENQWDELLSVAEKRYERLSKSEEDVIKIKKKLQDFLLRKGYNYSDIKTALNKIIKGEDFYN